MELQNYFNELIFDEKSHSYKVNSQYLRSVTSYIKTFQKPFDSFMVSTIVAKARAKQNKPADPAYYRKYWEHKAGVAREAGNLVHLFASCMPYFDDPQTNVERQVINFYNERIKDKEQIVATELIMYYGGLAGTADLITMKEDGTLHLWDYKTTVDLDKNKGKLLAPFEMFADSPLNTYTIQLVLYKWIIENATPYKVSELTIVSLVDAADNYEIVDVNDKMVKHCESLFKVNADKVVEESN